RQRLRADIAQWHRQRRISALLVVGPADYDTVLSTIRSVQNQIYEHWDLVISLDRPESGRLQKRLEYLAQGESRLDWISAPGPGDPCSGFNSALSFSSGEFVALLIPGARLSEHAFYWVTKELTLYPDADLIFSDEARIDRKGRRTEPWFK